MALKTIDFGLLTDVQLIELLREGSVEAVGRGGAMERAAREAVEQAVERRKRTEEELTRIRRLLARMVVETVGNGWKLTLGGRDLQVTIEHPGASRGWGSDARRFTLYVTGNRWNDPGSCTSNLGGNEGTSVGLLVICRMAVENFTRLEIDCDRIIASDAGLPDLPLPVPFAEAMGKIHAGRDLMAEKEIEADAVRRYGGWILHLKSLRLLPQGVEVPKGLSSPYVVAVVRRPKYESLGIIALVTHGKRHVALLRPAPLDRWPDCWRSQFEAELPEWRRLLKRGVRSHQVPAEEVAEFLAMLRRAESGRRRRGA
jgi:hypothetical protein